MKTANFTLALLLVISGASGFSAFAQSRDGAANWPQWRGPQSAGVSEEKNLPTEWGADKNVVWKTALPGRGHSSPIVWDNKIFLTTSIEGEVVPGAKAVHHVRKGETWVHPDSVAGDRKHTLKVICLDRDSGKILWERTAYEGVVYDDRHRKNGYASSTPVTDGEVRLCVLRGRRALLLRLQRQADLENRRGQDRQDGNGARHIAGALRKPVVSAMRPGRRRA